METPHSAFLDKEPVAPATHGGKPWEPRRGPSAFFDRTSTPRPVLAASSSRSRGFAPTLVPPLGTKGGHHDRDTCPPPPHLPPLRAAVDGRGRLADVGCP